MVNGGWWLFWILLYEVGWVMKYLILRDRQIVPVSPGTENKRSPTRAEVSKPFSGLIAGSNTRVFASHSYRLAPKHHFPIQFEDVYSVTKFFLQSSVLSQYGVDPDRVCVAGDSAGGNLAAAVAQQVKTKSWFDSSIVLGFFCHFMNT